MAQETLGYIKLEWTCPKCGSRNPGPEKACLGCGAVQPEDVQFTQAETQTLIKNEKEIEQAKAGADFHCAFCGARNPAGTETCSQCGADLKHGKRRETGQVVGAFQMGPVKQVACSSCGKLNPQTALKCAGCGANLALEAKPAQPPVAAAVKKPMSLVTMILIGAVIFLCLALAIGGMVAASRTEGKTALVQNIQWTTSIPILALQPVTYQNWQQEIPSQAVIGECQQRVHHVQANPAPNANKVCGTPYTVDKGSGYAEVVQDCQFEVLMPFCEYSVDEWRVIDTVTLHGTDFYPAAPQPVLQGDQRLGEAQAEYLVVFRTEDGTYSYTTSDLNTYRQFELGSEWVLNINGFNQIVSLEPAR